MKVIKISFITLFLLLVVVLSMGGGHGTYLLAKIIYPLTMIIAILTKSGIGIFSSIIAIIQIPVYSLVILKKPKWKLLLFGIHIILVIICLNLPTKLYT